MGDPYAQAQMEDAMRQEIMQELRGRAWEQMKAEIRAESEADLKTAVKMEIKATGYDCMRSEVKDELKQEFRTKMDEYYKQKGHAEPSDHVKARLRAEGEKQFKDEGYRLICEGAKIVHGKGPLMADLKAQISKISDAIRNDKMPTQADGPFAKNSMPQRYRSSTDTELTRRFNAAKETAPTAPLVGVLPLASAKAASSISLYENATQGLCGRSASASKPTGIKKKAKAKGKRKRWSTGAARASLGI